MFIFVLAASRSCLFQGHERGAGESQLTPIGHMHNSNLICQHCHLLGLTIHVVSHVHAQPTPRPLQLMSSTCSDCPYSKACGVVEASLSLLLAALSTITLHVTSGAKCRALLCMLHRRPSPSTPFCVYFCARCMTIMLVSRPRARCRRVSAYSRRPYA